MGLYESVVEYRYFLTDLLTNTLISEVPFKGVSYERANRRAGAFSGNIPFIPETKGLDLYDATMPGRTGLYITRNNQVVWGGIIWSRSYDVENKNLSVNGAEFISYLYHRHIWQTLIYGSEFIGVSTYSVSSGVATVTTEIPHGIVQGDMVAVTYTSPAIDGTHQIISVLSATSFSFSTTSADISTTANNSGACRILVDTYDFARSIVSQVANDLGGVNFVNEAIKPAKEFEASIISKSRTSGFVTLRTSNPHGLILGQEFEALELGSDLDGVHNVLEIPDDYTVVYELAGPDVPTIGLSGIRTLNVATKSLTDSHVATITTDTAHGATVGQTVVISGVDGFFTGLLDTVFNGRFTITGTTSSNSISFESGGILPVETSPANGGTATLGSKIVFGDYGSFAGNSDIDLNFEDMSLSGKYQDTQTLRGYENKTAGEILEQYSTNIDGFEYRIDCDYNYDTASFTRTFILIDSTPATIPTDGSIYAVTDLGAQYLVFEFPGNISTFSVSETAEEAATRFFVQGNIPDLGQDASKPYAASSAADLLSNSTGRNWPLLDQLEVLNDVSSESELYRYAQDYLYESRPPIGDFKLTVNGSIDPTVGSYNPGDWCSIIIDDEFVRARLANDQEPRDDIIIRKINSYKVNVPDSPTMPEVVDLTLVTDWKTDKNGK